LIVIFFISKGPSGLIDLIVASGRWGSFFGIKFKGGVRRKNVFKNKISLLIRKLIRKIDRLRKSDIDGILNGKKLKKKFGIVLQKSFFDVLRGCR